MESIVTQLLHDDYQELNVLIIVLTEEMKTNVDEKCLKDNSNILPVSSLLNIKNKKSKTVFLYLEKIRYLYIYLTYLCYNVDDKREFDHIIILGLDLLIDNESLSELTEILRLTNLVLLKIKELKQKYQNASLEVSIIPTTIESLENVNSEKKTNLEASLPMIQKLFQTVNSYF